ncbi:MAG: HD domain-containing protein, partial [Demequinaceae bacterium]|nr:HD domain-containing protein [Demequinaceae bacterium]
ASHDPIAAAGLLDLRHVAGDAALIEKAHSAILADWRITVKKHLPELLSGARTRAERFGELAFLIEPNLKEARGGLRDYTNLTALTATWLADRPHGAVDAAAEHLRDVRDALQVVSGGPQVILGRHVAEKVATRMGYRSTDDLLSSLTDTGRRIAYALDVTERNAMRALTKPERGSRIFLARHRRVPPSHVLVAPGLIEIGPDLALASDARPEDDALLPLRVGAIAATMGLNPTPRLLEALPKTPSLSDPWPPEALPLFLDLLRSSERLFEVWEALDLSGAIVRWIPEWEGIRNRPQRSPVHRFTVDRHSIEAVIQAGPLTPSVDNPDLLLLVVLFHDLGKRPGAGDHSEAGAALIPVIAARMGLAPSLAEDLETLVRHHLLLAELASSEDPAAPETVATLLEPLGHRSDLFDTLRALTEADAIAAGPKAWKPWRQALVDTLTRAARAKLASRKAASH